MKKIIGHYIRKYIHSTFKHSSVFYLKLILFVTIIMLISTGCTKHSINLNEEKIDKRIICLFKPLKDITGSYSVVEPKLEAILENNYDVDFVEYKPKFELPVRDRSKSLIQPNFIIVKRDSIITEESAISEILESSKYNSEYKLLISGTVEQLKYGAYYKVEEYISDIYLWGLAPTLVPYPTNLTPIPKEISEYRTALLEYNIKVYDFQTRELISSWTIQGAATSPERNREKIVKTANTNVSDGILVKLNEIYTAIRNIKPKVFYERNEKYYRYKIRR